MSSQQAAAITFSYSAKHLRQRIFSVLPATLSWGTLIGLSILALIVPWWIALFIILYDLYALVRAGYMVVHLVAAYRRLKNEKQVDWIARCRGVSGDIASYRRTVEEALHASGGADDVPRGALKSHLDGLRELERRGTSVISWEKVHHIVILPTYNESLTVLQSSLEALSRVSFPLERLHVVVGFEERAGSAAQERAEILEREYGDTFGTFLTTTHPDGIEGEARVKSANATWAVKQLEPVLETKGIPVENILVNNFDSDTVVAPNYFGVLTYAFITHPNRWRASYQPLPMYHNNIWDAPAFSRVIAAGSTFWQMIESTRPERLVTFSSHAMTLQALKDVDYWHVDKVSEDSRIFWQCVLHYDGDYETVPLTTTVSMDAALAETWWRTLINQYKQKRRWAWGIENFPYIAEGFWTNKKIKLAVKARHIFRTLEGHFSWATTPIIIAGLGWLPILFGGAEFHRTVLSYSLPYVARGLMTVAMAGLLVSAALTMLLLPARPPEQARWKYAAMFAQWALVPLIATVLAAFPALDAETRLALGRDLNFNVMEKARRSAKS